jgi:fibronectin type 3 domain-containing protein
LEKDLAIHRIYRQEGGSSVLVAELASDRTSWIDTEVRAGRRYRYTVTEVDASGNESEPSREVEVIPSDLIAPDPPFALEIQAERKGFRLTWQPSPSQDVTGYLIYRTAYAGAPQHKLTRSPLAATSFTDRQGQAGNLYGVAAVDNSGNEGPMATITAGENAE